jgi:hypothetical protein
VSFFAGRSTRPSDSRTRACPDNCPSRHSPSPLTSTRPPRVAPASAGHWAASASLHRAKSSSTLFSRQRIAFGAAGSKPISASMSVPSPSARSARFGKPVSPGVTVSDHCNAGADGSDSSRPWISPTMPGHDGASAPSASAAPSRPQSQRTGKRGGPHAHGTSKRANAPGSMRFSRRAECANGGLQGTGGKARSQQRPKGRICRLPVTFGFRRGTGILPVGLGQAHGRGKMPMPLGATSIGRCAPSNRICFSPSSDSQEILLSF